MVEGTWVTRLPASKETSQKSCDVKCVGDFAERPLHINYVNNRRSEADCLEIHPQGGMDKACENSPRASDCCRVGDRATTARGGDANGGLVTTARRAKT